MKRKILQIGSVLMAFYVLLISMDVNVSFHLCSESHHLIGSFGDASRLCEHCHEHHHAQEQESGEVGLFAKCCCENINQIIGFSEGFTVPTENPFSQSQPFVVLSDAIHILEDAYTGIVSWRIAWEKVPCFLTGRFRTIFFSNLKINPLV